MAGKVISGVRNDGEIGALGSIQPATRALMHRRRTDTRLSITASGISANSADGALTIRTRRPFAVSMLNPPSSFSGHGGGGRRTVEDRHGVSPLAEEASSPYGATNRGVVLPNQASLGAVWQNLRYQGPEQRSRKLPMV